jgi:hypothetical protein
MSCSTISDEEEDHEGGLDRLASFSVLNLDLCTEALQSIQNSFPGDAIRVAINGRAMTIDDPRDIGGQLVCASYAGETTGRWSYSCPLSG